MRLGVILNYTIKPITDRYRIKMIHKLKPLPASTDSRTPVWRDMMSDHYSVREIWESQPVDLSNVALLKTRENLFIKATGEPFKGDRVYSHYAAYERTENIDLSTALKALEDMLYGVKNIDKDLPVAFAANALYALEKNNLRNMEAYEKVLFPLLRKKIDYLHGEGIVLALNALGNLDKVDEDLVSLLVDHLDNHSIGDQVSFLRSERYSMD